MALKMDIDLTIKYKEHEKDIEFLMGDNFDVTSAIAKMEEELGESIEDDKLTFEVTYADYPKYEGVYTFADMELLIEEICR